MERRKPLRRDGEGARRFATHRSALNRKALPDRHRNVAQHKPRPATPDPITPDVDAALRQRSGGMCEVRAVSNCAGYASHRHHRKLRRHGDHRLVNLLHVCSACHDAIHGRYASDATPRYPATSYRMGWLVRAWADPADVPVVGPLT